MHRFLLLVLLCPLAAAQQAAVDSTVKAWKEGMAAIGVDAEALRPHHDYLTADPYRLPMLDAYLKAPLDVPKAATAEFWPWIAEREGLTASLRRALKTLRGKAPAEATPAKPTADDLAKRLRALPGAKVPDDLDAQVARIPEPCRVVLAALLVELAQTVKARTSAFAKLSEAEWVELRKFGSQFNTAMPAHVQVQIQKRLHARIDLGPIAVAACRLAALLETHVAPLAGTAGKAEFQLRVESALGLIEIGGWGRNTYADDALLTVDLGGDDTYSSSAGGTLYTPHKVSLCVDLGGDDRYASTVGLAQGSGIYGVGMLLDCAGDDTYVSKNVSQGAGHMGVGVLWDRAGNDRYTAQVFAQGAGFGGVGLLRDEGGADAYTVGTTGQGFGGTQGLGVLHELAGDDRYSAGNLRADTGRDPKHFLSMSQGFGLGNRGGSVAHCTSGGIGLLADRAGDDRYKADVFGQGCAYWYAIGVLLDGAGKDRYDVFNYGQGAGIHMAVGILVDAAGDDTYHGGHHATGHALDRAFGLFLELGGNDTYVGLDSECQGCAVKPYAVAVFHDLDGVDTYRGGMPGYVRVPPKGDVKWPKAFFIDSGGGKDVYQPLKGCAAANGTRWTYNKTGSGVDR